MRRWRYEIFELRVEHTDLDPDVGLVVDLNNMGADGWELVSFSKFGPIEYPGDEEGGARMVMAYSCLCKREIEET